MTFIDITCMSDRSEEVIIETFPRRNDTPFFTTRSCRLYVCVYKIFMKGVGLKGGRGLPGKLTRRRGQGQTRHPLSQVDRDQQGRPCVPWYISAIAAVCAWALSAGVIMVTLDL